jgi:hypothetical protein
MNEIVSCLKVLKFFVVLMFCPKLETKFSLEMCELLLDAISILAVCVDACGLAKLQQHYY